MIKTPQGSELFALKYLNVVRGRASQPSLVASNILFSTQGLNFTWFSGQFLPTVTKINLTRFSGTLHFTRKQISAIRF